MQERPINNKTLNLLVALACIAFSIGCGYTGGIDLNWDLTNYHLYSGYAFMNDLLGKDFMAAGMLSYINPLPNVPFYLMIRAGWSSLAIGLVLSAVHALNLLLLWKICRQLLDVGNIPSRYRSHLALIALALGAASPVFISEIGTSYADISLSILVLAGVSLLLKSAADNHLHAKYVLLGGVAFGAAAGLKLTNLPFALSACVFALAPGIGYIRRTRFLLLLVLGGLAGALLTYGYWGFRLYHEFHNPVFPFANGLFKSPDFPAISFTHRRFLPRSFHEAIAFPFYMAVPKSQIYTEHIAPDFRFAIFFLICAVSAPVIWIKKTLPAKHAVDVSSEKTAPLLFLMYVLLSWCIWLAEFGNGRYFIPLALLIGPAIVLALMKLPSARAGFFLATLCLLLQVGQLYVAGNYRYGYVAKWDDKWFDLDIPAKLKKNAYLFLGMDVQSNSYLAAFMNPGSRFVNIDGMVPLDLKSPGKQRLEKLLHEFDGRTRILVNGIPTHKHTLAVSFTALNADINRLGLRIDETDCVALPNRTVQNIYRRALSTEIALSSTESAGENITSCGVVRVPVDASIEDDRMRAASLFDKVERLCPKEFPTHSGDVVMRDKVGRFWARFYVDTDLWLTVDEHYVVARLKKFPYLKLGDRNAIESGAQQPDCSKLKWHTRPSTSVDFEFTK